MNWELLKNIGLGLFVNGSYSILNGTFEVQPYIITILSIYIMYVSIKKGEK